jgi:hypothetical protein
MDRTLGFASGLLSGHDPQSNDRAEYIPGVCNIGPAEIAKRRRSGWGGALATAAIWAVLAIIDAPPAVRLVTFFPAAMAAAGFLQAWMHFCAYFGFASLLNFGPEAGKTDTVVEAEFRRKDRIKAWQILGYSVVIGLAVAAVAYLV